MSPRVDIRQKQKIKKSYFPFNLCSIEFNSGTCRSCSADGGNPSGSVMASFGKEGALNTLQEGGISWTITPGSTGGV